MTVTLVHPIREATKIGREQGKSAASWVDINSDSDARRILELSDNCELFDAFPSACSPLSGESGGGYLTSDLWRDCGISDYANDSLEFDWLLDATSTAFEDAYGSSFEDSLVTRASEYLA